MPREVQQIVPGCRYPWYLVVGFDGPVGPKILLSTRNQQVALLTLEAMVALGKWWDAEVVKTFSLKRSHFDVRKWREIGSQAGKENE